MERLVGGLVLLLGSLVALGALRVAVRRARQERAVVGGRRSVFVEIGKVSTIACLGMTLVSIFLIVSSFLRVVPANTVGVPTTFGKVGSPLSSGLHVTLPWTEITQFSTRVQELSMLRAADEGDLAKDDSITVISLGGGSMAVDVTVRFSVASEEVGRLFREAGSVDQVKDRFVRPETREVVRNIFGKFNAEEGYSSKRTEIASQITEELRIRLATRGIRLDTINVRDVAPEQQVLNSINAVLQARNEAAQASEDQKKQVTEAETRKAVAELDKQATITKAEADAEAVRISADAQASANQAIAASLTDDLVELEIARACADAIANTSAQVVNVCSQALPSNADGGSSAATTVIVDGRAPSNP